MDVYSGFVESIDGYELDFDVVYLVKPPKNKK